MFMIYVLNGLNLNFLGQCQFEIYGSIILVDVENVCVVLGKEFGIEICFFQFNYEGVIVDMIYEVRQQVDVIVINFGVLIYILVVIFDVLNIFDVLVIEVYILNIYKCESFCYYFYVSLCVEGVIVGLGINGYFLVLCYLVLLVGVC